MEKAQKLFRDKGGVVKEIFAASEGISYRENPLDFFILLARYKFAARLIKKTDHVLDAGCGHGLGSVFLSRFAGSVTGTDFDRELVENCAAQYADIPNLQFKTLDLLDTAPHKEKYDVVVSMDVIEHFTQPDTKIVAKNYARLLKPGGFAVIGTPNIVSQTYASKRRLATHLHEFNNQEFQSLLEQHFKHVFLFSMTDEVVSLSFPKLAWYLMALCTL